MESEESHNGAGQSQNTANWDLNSTFRCDSPGTQMSASQFHHLQNGDNNSFQSNPESLFEVL